MDLPAQKHSLFFLILKTGAQSGIGPEREEAGIRTHTCNPWEIITAVWESCMQNTKKIFGIILLLCSGFLMFAYYLQHFQNIGPCPLCVLQRYAFALIALFCLLGRYTRHVRFAAFMAFLSAAGGTVAAAMQLWMPGATAGQCKRSSLELLVNNLITAKWFPFLFEADGTCDQILDRILGLTIPMWSFGWLVLFAFVFLIIVLRSKKNKFIFR